MLQRLTQLYTNLKFICNVASYHLHTGLKFIYNVISYHGFSVRLLGESPRLLHSLITRPISPSHLPIDLQVEVTNACNLRCVMCKGAGFGEAEKYIDFSTFRSIVDQLPNLYHVIPQGVGEPLLNPDLTSMVRYAASRRVAVEFNTNGTLLDASQATKLIDAGLHALTVSFDGATPKTFERIRVGAKFAHVVANLRALRDIKREKGTKLPRVRFNVVVMKNNISEVPDILHLAHTLGVEMVILSPLQISTPALAEFACDPMEWKSLFGHFALARKLGIDLFVYQSGMHPPSHFSLPLLTGEEGNLAGIRRSLFEPISEDTTNIKSRGGRNRTYSGEQNWTRGEPASRFRRRASCSYPWFSLYVTADGYVMPCCWAQDPSRNHLGHVLTEALASIWWSSKYQSFRHQLTCSALPLPEACSSCPLAGAV